MKPVSPSNMVYVTVTTKWVSQITNIMRLSQIMNDSSIDANDVVQIVGQVVSLPKKISNRIDFIGFSTKDIKEGDIVIFASSVINDVELIGDDEEAVPHYKNMFYYRGVEYFAVDIRKIFGVIRNNEIIMINGYTMCDIYEDSKIIIPQHLRKIKKAAKTTMLYIGNSLTSKEPITAQSGDTVYFNNAKAAKYKLGNKKFCIIPQNHILGREVVK